MPDWCTEVIALEHTLEQSVKGAVVFGLGNMMTFRSVGRWAPVAFAYLRKNCHEFSLSLEKKE